jgi:hypothetical protein
LTRTVTGREACVGQVSVHLSGACTPFVTVAQDCTAQAGGGEHEDAWRKIEEALPADVLLRELRASNGDDVSRGEGQWPSKVSQKPMRAGAMQLARH